MKTLKGLRSTLVAAILAIALVVFAGLVNFDVVQLNVKLLAGIGAHEIDDLLVGFALILGGLILDRVAGDRKRRRQVESEAEKLRTLQATMRTVQDIVNNSLNQMQLLRIEADGLLPGDVLRDFDTAIEDTSERLRALGNLEKVQETTLAMGIGIEYTVPVYSPELRQAQYSL